MPSGSVRASVACGSRVPTATSWPRSTSLAAMVRPTVPVPRTAIFMGALPVPRAGRQVRLPDARTVADRPVCVACSRADDGGIDDRPAPAGERRPGPHPGDGVPALLCTWPPGGRGRHDHRRVGGREGDVLQALPGQGRPHRGLSGQGRRGLDRAAAGRRRGRRARPGRPAGGPLRRAADRVPPGRLPRLRLHQRGRGVRPGDRSARAHRRAQATGARVAARAWRDRPVRRSPSGSPAPCHSLLDGALSNGALDPDPEAAEAARATAAHVVRQAVRS